MHRSDASYSSLPIDGKLWADAIEQHCDDAWYSCFALIIHNLCERTVLRSEMCFGSLWLVKAMKCNITALKWTVLYFTSEWSSISSILVHCINSVNLGVFCVVFGTYKCYIIALNSLGGEIILHVGFYIECIYCCICSYVLGDLNRCRCFIMKHRLSS